MEKTMLCPHCGSDKFIGIIKTSCAMTVTANENDELEFHVLKKGHEAEYEVIACGQCHEEVSNEELVAAGKCSKCGNIVPVTDLENGICPMCRIEENRPDLANMTPQMMMKKILELEKNLEEEKAKKKASKVLPKQKNADKKEVPVESTESDDKPVQETKQEEPEPTSEPEPEKEIKPRRKAKRKKKQPKNDDDAKDEVTQEDKENLENQDDDPPFPDINDEDTDTMLFGDEKEETSDDNDSDDDGGLDLFGDDDSDEF